MINSDIKNTNLKAKISKVARSGPLVTICFIVICLFIFIAVAAPVLTPYTPYQQSLKDALSPSSSKYWLGTDNLGRDLLTRLMYGARISMTTSLISSLWAAAIGTAFGLIAGYSGGFLNQIIMRITDAMLSIPPLILNMVLAGAVGGNIFGISFIIGLSIMPNYIRMVNSLVLSLRENDYIVASRIIGQKTWKIMMKHLLPNCFASLIVIFAINLGNAIMLEANLSFLGIGISAPTPAWGAMVSDGYKYMISQPRLAILPGLCVMIIVIAFNIVGDSLRDVLDPRLRGKL